MAETKLKITAYTDDAFGSQAGSFDFRYNPANIDWHYSIVYDSAQATGTSGREGKYAQTEPEELAMELIFDATIYKEGETSITSVHDQLTAFKDLAFKYQGDIHRPYFLQLLWGNIEFKGQAKDMQVQFSSFNGEGVPLRAKAKVTFVKVLSMSDRLSAEQRSSPDLTHYHLVKEGDALPLLSEKIYGSPLYYIEIARINNLNSFRKLEPGTKLLLPPLEK